VPNSDKGESIENLFLISAIIIGFGRSCSTTQLNSTQLNSWRRTVLHGAGSINEGAKVEQGND